MADQEKVACGAGRCSQPVAQGGDAIGGPAVRTQLVVYINAETMGRGDDELGRVIMGAYMETLAHFARDISHVIFVNSGVRLACEGSPVLDHLKDLADMDIEMLCCGTCLNHFNIKEKLQVGSVSNMFTILEIISKADKVLSP